MDATTVGAVLAWVNEQRTQIQERAPLTRLPRGYREDHRACPIANALNHKFDARVDGITAQFEGADGTVNVVSLPSSCIRFIDAFDYGHLPEYDKEEE